MFISQVNSLKTYKYLPGRLPDSPSGPSGTLPGLGVLNHGKHCRYALGEDDTNNKMPALVFLWYGVYFEPHIYIYIYIYIFSNVPVKVLELRRD